MMRYGAWMAIVVLSSLAAPAAAQPLTLDCTTLQVNSGFTVSLSGSPLTPFHVALDVSPGPIWTAEVGPVHLGFTPLLVVLPLMQFDATGAATFGSAVNQRPDWVGNVIYAQAVGVDSSSPTGYAASNPLARPIHHETRSGSAPVVIPLADNDAQWLDMPFAAFPFFGSSFTRVGVSSNGLLTFDGLNSDPTEHEVDFRGGLPKIAVLWDDLVPQAPGQVEWEGGPDFVRITWRDLHQPWQSDLNTASATLYDDGAIALQWDAVATPDALVGVSPGGWTGAPIYADFSAGSGGVSLPVAPVFEGFYTSNAPFDLQGHRLTFLPQGAGFRWIH